MAERRDKLGRRIPEFDRSAASKQGAKTQKEKYGSDFHARNGSAGGKHRGRGYFGQLKDEGKTKELKDLSHQANEARKIKKVQTTKGKTNGSGSNASIPGRRA
jgi:hypothetical protein